MQAKKAVFPERKQKSKIPKSTPDTLKEIPIQSIPVSLVSLEDKANILAQYLADPRELRTDEELSQDLDIPLSDIKKLKASPKFIEPVNQAFRRNLQIIGPEIIRKIFRQALDGSVQSQKLLLEASRWIESGGSKVQVNIGGVSVGTDQVSSLSDEDLDREINRLLMETYPEDNIYSNGKVLPSSSEEIAEVIEDAEYTDVRRSNNKVQEREDVSTSVGKTEKNGG